MASKRIDPAPDASESINKPLIVFQMIPTLVLDVFAEYGAFKRLSSERERYTQDDNRYEALTDDYQKSHERMVDSSISFIEKLSIGGMN